MVALVSGASESVYRGGRYPYVPGHISYTAMISAVKSASWVTSEPLMITLLTNFLTASSIVGIALSIESPISLDYGCTTSALAYKIASLDTRMRDSLLSSVLL